MITSSIKVWHVLLASSVVLFLGIMTQLIVAPIQTYLAWKAEASAYPQVECTTDSLSHMLSYQQALLKASTEDSIYMVISMPDSSVTIYVKGVGIYSTKIIHQSQSSFFSRLHPTVYQKQFADPQLAHLLYASVEKEPVKVELAPKNADEAAKMATIPDSVVFEPAFIGYQLENGMMIQFSPENESWLSFRKSLRLSTANCLQLFRALFHFEIQDFHPEIQLTVQNVDLTAIYRAIPHQPTVIVRL